MDASLLLSSRRRKQEYGKALPCKGGDIPQQGETLQDATFTQGYNNSYTFRAPPVNVAIKRAESDAHIDYPERE